MTAVSFFEQRGYQKIDRKDVPEVIQATSEFGDI